MKTKTFVADLDIGMYVCELDRPWSEAPFEPPFEVQGFFVSSTEELEKIRALCEYVYVDGHMVDATVANAAGIGHDPPPVSSRIGQAPARRSSTPERRGNIRYLPSYRFRALADDAGERDAAGLPKRTSDYEAVVKPGSKKWFFTNLGRDDQAQAHKRKRKRRASHAAQEPKRVEAGRATQHILMLFAKPKETEISTVYSDQCSMEEELSIAQQIATDTETIYRRVLKDIGSGRGIDAKAVAQTVQGLVESVIRNPDALTWLVRLKSRRHYTYSHSMAVCVLALALGRFLGLSKTDLQAIGMGTLLQDIGKLHVPRLLLDKSEKLTSVEKKIISEHVDAGVKMLKETDHIPMEVLDIVKSHHERYDGSGYPHAMHGDMISPFSAIAGMADTYEAMTSQRPYRNALTSLEALTVMYAMRDKAFPAAMIEHLIHCVGVFPVGSFVLLNTGSVGVVISRNRLQQLKPKVLPILDAQGDRVPHAETIDLAEQPADNEDLPWKITRVVDPEDYSLDPAEFFA